MALKEVTVINHTSTPLKDKHHGVEYVFAPNEKVLVPLAAAVHFFGVGLPKGSPARQMAWKRRGFTDEEKGEAFLKKFEAKVVDLVPEGSDVEEIKEKHAETIESLKEEHEKALAALEDEHLKEVERINKSHADEVGVLKSRIAELEAPASDGKSQKKK